MAEGPLEQPDEWTVAEEAVRVATQPECPNYAGASLVVAAFGQVALGCLLTRLGAMPFEHVPSAAWCADQHPSQARWSRTRSLRSGQWGVCSLQDQNRFNMLLSNPAFHPAPRSGAPPTLRKVLEKHPNGRVHACAHHGALSPHRCLRRISSSLRVLRTC